MCSSYYCRCYLCLRNRLDADACYRINMVIQVKNIFVNAIKFYWHRKIMPYIRRNIFDRNLKKAYKIFMLSYCITIVHIQWIHCSLYAKSKYSMCKLDSGLWNVQVFKHIWDTQVFSENFLKMPLNQHQHLPRKYTS